MLLNEQRKILGISDNHLYFPGTCMSNLILHVVGKQLSSVFVSHKNVSTCEIPHVFAGTHFSYEVL